MKTYDVLKAVIEDPDLKKILETEEFSSFLYDAEAAISLEDRAKAQTEAKEAAARVPRLGEISKGEYRLTGFETIFLGEDSQRRGFLKIIHKVSVQLPFTGNVLDFKLIQEIKPYNSGEVWNVDWGNDLPTSLDQLQSWLAAAAFAIQVKDQMDNIKMVQIFGRR